MSQLRKQYDGLAAHNSTSPIPPVAKQYPNLLNNKEVRRVIGGLDARGAWLSAAPLQYNKQPGPSIQMNDVVKNLNILAHYLANKHLP